MENHIGNKHVIHHTTVSESVLLVSGEHSSKRNFSGAPRLNTDVGGVDLCTMASISLTPAGCPRIQLISDPMDPETPSDP